MTQMLGLRRITAAFVAVAAFAFAISVTASPAPSWAGQPVTLHRVVANTSDATIARAGILRHEVLRYDPAETMNVGSALALVELSDIPPELPAVERALGCSTAGVILLVADTTAPAVLELVERVLTTRVATVATYLLREGPEAAALLAALQAHRSAVTAVTLVAKVPVAVPDSFSVPLITATLGASAGARSKTGAKRKVTGAVQARALLVAHFDSAGVAPSVPLSPSTGATVALEAARMLGARNLSAAGAAATVLLGGGSRLSYRAVKRWLAEQPLAFADDVDFALSLEDLVLPDADAPKGDGAADSEVRQRLYFHISHPPEGVPAMARAIELMRSIAAAHGIDIEVVARKIRVAAPEINWAHEPFAFRKLPAATLSARRTPVPHAQRASLAALARLPPTAVAAARLATHATIVAEFLAGLLSVPAVSHQSAAACEAEVAAWHRMHITTARPTWNTPAPFLATYASALQRAAGGAASSVATISYDVDAKGESQPPVPAAPLTVTATVTVALRYRTEQAAILATVLYLGVLAVVHFGAGGAAAALALFSSTKPRRD